MKEKKKYIIIGIVVIIVIALMVMIFSRDKAPELIPDKVISDENTNEIEEIKVNGYHLITYNQSANTNSYIQTLSVTASNPDSVKFVIGNIDENNFAVERMSFEVECQKGKNEFDLSNKKYMLKEGEYLFMDDFGQDILFQQENSDVKSLVQSEENKQSGKMKLLESNYIMPFEYTLQAVQEYHALVIGNDITTKDGGRGLHSTDDNLDYYALTKTRLQEMFGQLKMERINAVEWEKALSSEIRQDWIDKNLSLKDITGLDLVIFQLGDNYPLEEIANLEKEIQNLVETIRKYSPGAEMIWIGSWNADEKILLNLPAICEKLKISYIEIQDLYTDEYKSLVEHNEEEVVSADGTISRVANDIYYPNNEGMQMIANRIAEVLKLEF